MNKTLLLLIVCLAPLYALQNQWSKVNIIIASKSGLQSDSDLKYAYNDAKKLHTALSELSGIDPRDNFLIQTESADQLRLELYQIQEHIATLKNQKKKILLQFYYSGHGSGSSFHIGNQKLGFKEVKSILKSDRIDTRIFVLDVCFGGTFLNTKGFSKAKPIAINLELANATQGEVIISSSAVNEQAYEVETLEGSVFSSNWIMGLRGAGDKNSDGHVSLFEAYNHAYDQTVHFTSQTLNKSQHPSFNIKLTGAHDIILSSPNQSSNGIVLENCPNGLYTIYNRDRNHVIGDVRINQAGHFFLALPSGNYTITTVNSKGRVLEQGVAINASLASVDFKNFTYKKNKQVAHNTKGKSPEATIHENAPIKNEISFAKALRTHSRLFITKSFGYHNNSSFEKNINQNKPIEQTLSMQGTYKAKQQYNNGYGIGFLLSPSSNWGLLGSIEFYSLNYEMSGSGYESTVIPTPTLTVSFDGSYSLLHINWSIGLQKRVFTHKAHSIDCDIGASAVTQVLDHSWTMKRSSLQFDNRSFSTSSTTAGSQYNISTTYKYTWPKNINLALGARISAYYIDIQNSITHNEATVTYEEQEFGGKIELLLFIGKGE